MYSIALRFAEKFSPTEGTIGAHQQLIDEYGFVWYGKMGTKVSVSKQQQILDQKNPRILLIHSGGTERYWAHISAIMNERPDYSLFPQYYHSISENFNTWFKVEKFEKAPNDVMSKCKVVSSGQILSLASKYSMSPYFFIEYDC